MLVQTQNEDQLFLTKGLQYFVLELGLGGKNRKFCQREGHSPDGEFCVQKLRGKETSLLEESSVGWSAGNGCGGRRRAGNQGTLGEGLALGAVLESGGV